MKSQLVKVDLLILLTVSVVSPQNDTEDLDCHQTLLKDTLYDQMILPAYTDNPIMDQLRLEPCSIKLYHNGKYQLCGINCSDIISPPESNKLLVPFENITVVYTGIKILSKNSFIKWPGVKSLIISTNPQLFMIEPGAFHNMSNVWNLTIKDNPKLYELQTESFLGLYNLQELRFLRNGLNKVLQISPSLSPSILPNLALLDLSGNKIPSIDEDDFIPMYGSKLHTLYLIMTTTSHISPRALDHFPVLNSLYLGHNNIKTIVISALIHRVISIVPSFTDFSLDNNLVFVHPQKIFHVISKSGVKRLSLKNNHLGPLAPGYFPVMPSLESLDLSQNFITSVPAGVINETIMPNLKELYISKNTLPELSPNFLVATLRKLDVSYNEDVYKERYTFSKGFLSLMPKLEELYFSGNKIAHLQYGLFSYCSGLMVLSLSNTGLTKIDKYVFKSCSNLIYLDLSKNLFNEGETFVLSKETFLGLDKLVALDLSECGLFSLQDNHLFKGLPRLQYISLRKNSLFQLGNYFTGIRCLEVVDFRSNALQAWSERKFQKTRLKKLLIDNNQINTFNKVMFEDFSASNIVSIFGNPLLCNCELANSFKDFYEETRTINTSYLSCTGIHFKNHCFNHSTSKNNCIDKWLSNSLQMKDCRHIPEGGIALIVLTIVCLSVLGSFLLWHHFKYHFKYWYFISTDKIGLYLLPSRKKHSSLESDGYDYDAFVSYSHEDYKFVHRMATILEKDFHFKLCLYERDFEIGELISESVINKLSRSRKAVMILTESFAKSQWCLWELSIAQQRAAFFRTAAPDSLVIIMLGDIDSSLMTDTLKHLIRARIYLKWEPSISRQRLFWQQLREAISHQ